MNNEPPLGQTFSEPLKTPEKIEGLPGEPSPENPQISQIPVNYAGFSRRAIAMGIDCVIIAAFVYLTGATAVDFVEDGGFMLILYLVFYALAFPFAYFVYFHAAGGQTPGKRALGIRVVAQTGAGAGTARSVFRALGYSFSFAFFAAGFIWAIFDRRGQAWHDKIAGTVVLEI